MRIQIASDLHLEVVHQRFPAVTLVTPTDADVLVLAGDIANGTDAVEYFAKWPTPVVYVHGNHEAYRNKYDELADRIRTRATGTAVRYLERTAFMLGNVRFLGCCLWTDYALNGARDQSMRVARRRLHDHRVIMNRDGERFQPEHALEEHEKAVSWLREQLATPFEGKTVVVTHHGVSPSSVHPRYGADPANAAFVSDLGPLLRAAHVWIHGHVHDSFDYRVGEARVIANPRGYALNRLAARTPADLQWENPAYDSALVI
uniref:metallophosphoesterase n=1 Tax=Caballeronia sp. J97 TaxID=2805429 RepID=UPI002AB0C1FC